MKAWKFHSNKKVLLETQEPIVPPEGYVKVKVGHSILSGVDALLYAGKLSPAKTPITIGHQAVGMVSEVGAGVAGVARGDRVVLDPFVSCDMCGDNEKTKCYECADLKMYGLAQDGFMSDFVVVCADDAFKLPERVKDEDAIFSSHVAFAVNIINKLQLEKGEHIVIMGASLVGIILAQVALYYQAIPILVDIRGDRLNVAESLGVYYCINSVKEDMRKKIFSITGGNMAASVVYFPNADNALNKCLEYAATGGQVCIAGWNGTQPDLAGSFSTVLNKQLKVFGVNNGAKLIPAAINMLANRIVNVAPVISGTVMFSEVDKALAEQAQHPGKHIVLLVKM